MSGSCHACDYLVQVIKVMSLSFYNGGARERDILTKAYMRLIKHVNSIYKVCTTYNVPQLLTNYFFTLIRHTDSDSLRVDRRLYDQVYLVSGRVRTHRGTAALHKDKAVIGYSDR